MAKVVELTDIVRWEAERIRKALKDQKLWGHLIDLDDPDHALVGAYYMGRTDMYQLRRYPSLEDLTGGP